MSTLNKISLDGTVYDIGGGDYPFYQFYNTYTDPRDYLNTEAFTDLAKDIFDDLTENVYPIISVKHDTSELYRGVYTVYTVGYGNGKITSVTFRKDNGIRALVDTDGCYDSTDVIALSISYNTTLNDGTILSKSWYRTSKASGHKYLPTDTDSTSSTWIEYTPTQDTHPATKKYVDDRTLLYEDNGYYVKPTKWTVVSALPTEAIDDTTLYIVAPDYEERTVSTTVISNGFNSGVDWSHITNNLIKVGTTADPDIVESWQNTAENSGYYTTNWSVKTPKYNVNIGCTPMFTNTYNEDLYMHGLVEMRDSRGYLRYTAYVDVNENLQSGQLCYYDRDDEETYTDPISLNTNCPISFNYTIGTNGGLACLKGDTPVKIKGGKTKAIKSIKVGDTVIGADGKETKVIKLYNHKVPVTFNITLSNDDVLVASDCHKFSIKGHYRYACQVVKDHKLDRVDGSTFDVLATEIKEEETEVYEILTESGTYTLGNGIICECEAI